MNFKSYIEFSEYYYYNTEKNKFGVRVLYKGKDYFAREYKKSRILLLTDPTDCKKILFVGANKVSPIVKNQTQQ